MSTIQISCMDSFLKRATGTNSIFGSPIKDTNIPWYVRSFQQQQQPLPTIVVNNNNNSNQNSTIDEIDNKTSDQPGFFSKFVMNDIYRSEAERLKTFEEWPLDFIDKHVLAQTGMFYTRESDKVKCYFCEVEIGRWEESDHPVSEHIKWSANCPLLRRRTTNNIPLNVDALERVLPPASYDVCGSNDSIEVRPTAYPEGSISSAAGVGSGPSSPPIYQMDYPEYAIEAARCRSFAEWPRTMKQKPKELAEAGFFYTGVGDRVNCFSCGGGLKDWDENDEPWEQHAQWLSKCRYLKLMKGQAFIDAVIAKCNRAAEKTQEALSASAAAAASDSEVQECSTQTEEQNKQNCPASVTAATQVVANALTAAATTTTSTIDRDLLQRSDSNNSNSDKRIIPEEKLCKICYAAEYNTAFLPCGHVVACTKCASSVIKCPMCRKPFKDVMRVYFS
ncbi:death-associated inhibitor of apoptosis 1 [Episyrphus balteatus]|uniref:death-associated inhibitor of apoptosis 1 n=1 Tax=Episyrphus balteatus TaxID=286459 RepID=UPI0024857467|nr:death-associated inhibitor of apoptosis 1 [Episyrphus balteatus]XP_055840778.1 death-associated inhibitor of apoptosis 1 [Episyrphus balteatus]XP_055840779.1 death-associated inhibitor of apoptosis 1 [Episyrphus balteatus]XP_055840780.1 death-associated inhibitor of apoptosis 1 [Episyrphus balteatus]XP_055840781.1 death-associated inhibitor of apoptosis 1 [Episyrphus balteatus]XP_055840782.1 death-associated inhibitor of apoptosis 1 [Episyrphus balteatus]XP_055840783.1 death-associated inh